MRLPISPLIILMGCGGGSKLASPPTWGTEAKWLVTGGCGAIGSAPPGQRRLEVILEVEHGNGWVLLGDKNRLHATQPACFAVDAPEGEIPVTIRARADGGHGGVGVGVEIAARDAEGQARRAFILHCGVPGRCERQALRAWDEAVEADRHRLGDPCAAAQVRGIRWESGATSDGTHPEDIQITFKLRVGKSLADECAPPVPPPPEPPPETPPPIQ